MLRFTIRDLLWLMVVVGLFLAWAMSGTAELDRLKRENANLEQAIVDAVREWSKEKGEPAHIDAGGHIVTAWPDGTVGLAAKKVE